MTARLVGRKRRERPRSDPVDLTVKGDPFRGGIPFFDKREEWWECSKWTFSGS
jgi:hypothetical protein